jgi:hypothetical protein
MSCTKYRRMLHLHRPGELSGREQAKLARHLATCAACTAEQQEVLAADRFLQQVRSMAQAAEGPDTITPRILAAIERRPSPARMQTKTGIASRIADMVFAPVTRYATVALASACIVLFLTQSVGTLRTVSTLDRSIPVRREGPKLAYVVSSDILMIHPMMRPLWSLALQKSAARMGDNLVIPRATIEQFIDPGSPEAAAAMTGAMLSGISARRVWTIFNHIQQTSEITLLFDTRGR